MRVQLASDLHLEFLVRDRPSVRLFGHAEGVDVLVLAGDISVGPEAIELFADWPARHVVYVAGNHEYYGGHWESTVDDIRAAARGTKLHFLENDSLVIDGVRFLGCTLWTDFALAGYEKAMAMDVAERFVLDYALVHTNAGLLRAADTIAAHIASRAFLASELETPFAGKTVVVTHHAPHPLSIHPRFAKHPANPAFINDLTQLLASVDLWLHGHVHDSFDYRVGRCRVVANPAGYVLNRPLLAPGMRPQLQNEVFDEGLVIEV
jgi:predicted phosphohydrolase